MTKKLNRIINITTVLLALLLLGIAAGPASAAVTSVNLSDGNDGVYFYGENITITWQDDGPESFISINSTGSTYNGTDDGNNMYDNKNGATLLAKQVDGIGTTSPFSFTYTFANYTVNQSARAWLLYINTSGTDMINSSSKTAFMIMSYNVSLQTGRSAAEGNSTLAGDTIQVNLNTFGLGAKSNRDSRAFTISLPEGGNTVSAATNVATTGNYTFNITTTQSGVGVLRNITLNYGGFSWNSTQLVTYSGWASATNTSFNVSQVNLRAYSVGVGASPKNITSVNITSKDLSGTLISANPAYAVNVTLTNSITDVSKINFNSITPGYVNNYTVNVTFPIGVGDAITWGNYTNPINTSEDISVTTATAGTITAVTNKTGSTSWTSSYTIYPGDSLITIGSPTASQAFVVGANITITGWSSNTTAPVSINVTGTAVINKTSPTVSGTKEIWNTSVTPDPTDGSFTATWVTNNSWNSTNNYNVFYAPMGTYVIKANSTNTTVSYVTQSITFSETLAVTTNRTSNVVSIDSPILLNFTTNRLNNNWTTYWYNITSGSTVINNTLSHVIINFNSTTNTSSGSLLWIPVDNVIQFASLGVNLNSANISTTVQVKDNATTTTATVYVTDYVTVNNVVGVAGNTVNFTGTTARANGSNNVINISIYELIGGVRGNWKLENIALATVNNNAWYNNSVYLTSTGAVGGTSLAAGTYQIEVNDTIVKALGTLTIGTGTITVDPQLTAYGYDGTAYITGSTNLPTGTNLTINITTAAGAIVNNTIYAIVNATQYFNATWPINQSAALIGNFTKPSTVYTINATNISSGTTYFGLGNITLSSDITVSPSRTSVVTGDNFNISGTSGRVAGTTLLINVTSGNFNVGTTATVSATGTFEITVSATQTLASGGTNLVNGAYTIKVNDSTGLQITNTSTFNVVNPSVTLVLPVSGTAFANSSNISIGGTSNRGSGVLISLTITGVNYALTGVTATTDANGNFTYYWNTSSDANGNAVAAGTYSVTAVSGTVASNALSIVLAAPALASLTVTPAGTTITADQTQQFTATGYDQSSNPTTITPAVVWTSSNTTVGTINETIGLFTAIKVGTTTITATNGTNGTVSGTTTINVTTGALAAITVTPAAPQILVNATQTFTATGADADGNAVSITPAWNSSNTSVGTINSSTGVFTAVAEGTTTINATSGSVSGNTTATVTASAATGTPALVSAITPNSRNAQLGTPVTLFMSVINYGNGTATGVSITQASSLPATVSYQQWDGTSLIGSANTPVDMAAGATAHFVLAINATSAFDSSSLTFNVSGTNVAAAPISAVNTLTISANATPSADVIMISTTLSVSTPVNNATAFAVATTNVGGASATGVSLVVSVPSTITGLAYQVNQTNSTTGEIIGPATGLTIAVGAQPTFAVFLTPTQAIAFDPTNNRITLQLVDGSGKVIGAQSVAVSTT